MPLPNQTNAIADQIKEIRGNLKKGRAGTLDNRGRFVYWQTPKGQWRRKLDQKGTRAANATAPTGKYRGKDGKWRDARRKGKRTEAPFRFQPVKLPRRSNLTDAKTEAGIEAMISILDEITPDNWLPEMLPPIEPRKAAHKDGGVNGTVVGWRLRFSLSVQGKSDTIHEEVAAALEAMAESRTILKSFGGQLSRAMAMFSAVDSNGVDGTYTASAARVFQSVLFQAAELIAEKGKKYPDWKLFALFFYLQ